MTLQPGAHTWIDKIAEVFAISNREGGTIRSYRQADLKDLPERITGAQAPCVVHYVITCQPMYSTGGPTILHWTGRSDFHLFKDVKPSNFSEALPFFPLILAAAMGSMQLSGTVNEFVIPEQGNAIRFVTYRNIDGSESHQGIEVNWNVKQSVTGSYTISA